MPRLKRKLMHPTIPRYTSGMTPAVCPVTFISRHRRLLAMCTATVALHFVTIDWLGSRLGAQPAATRKPAVMTAQLRLALPARQPAAAPPQEVAPLPDAHSPDAPSPQQVMRHKQFQAMALPAPEALDAMIPSSALSSAASSSSSSSTPAGAGGVTDTQAALEKVLAAMPPVQTETPAPAAADAGAVEKDGPLPLERASTRRYKVNLPPSAAFDLELTRTDAKGSQWSASGSMVWKSDGSKYKVVLEAGLSMLVARVNLLELISEGEIDDAGIAPDKFTEKRRGRAQTATHFLRNEGKISFSASERSYPLLAGAQDRASIPFQLAAIGRANVNQFGGDIDIMVGDNRDASIYRFQLVGEEALDTKMGRVVTWHLARPARPGSYSARLDIWLAPGLQWFPIQIRNTEANGALTTQTVTRISMNEQAGK